MATELTIKQKKFTKEYVKNQGNGTQAALEVYDTTSENMAAVIASKNISKDKIKRAITEELEAQGLTVEEISKILTRNAKQERDLSNSNRAVDIAARMRGLYPDQKDTDDINAQKFLDALKKTK